MSSRERLRILAFALVAGPTVVACAWRIASSARRLGFDALLAGLRARSAHPLPSWLARPERLAETVEKLLPVLPPRSYGLCLRRSLILLELWSRCGLKLHLGFRLTSPDRAGHAWITATAKDGRRLQASGPLDTVPAFEL
jgi:hypothetical protein